MRGMGFMKGLFRWFVLVIPHLILAGRMVGQTLSASVDQTSMELGSATVLNLKFEDIEISRPPQLPPIANAHVQYIGPIQNLQIINGQRRSAITFRYQITPQAVGEIRIPGFALKIKDKAVNSEAITIQVSPASVTAAPTGDDRLAFVRLLAPTNTVYEGESFPIEVRLFSQVAENISPPQLQLDGFVLGKQAQPEQGQTIIGRERYGVVGWKMGLHAVKPGELLLGPAEVGAVLRLPSRGRNGLFDDGFFGSIFGERKSVNLISDSNVVRVVPLPREGRPSGFAGAVGQFQMEAVASPIQVRVGDPITVKVTVSGKGNLESVTPPQWDSLNGFRTYDPQTELKFTDAIGLEGSKHFELILVPEREGIDRLPAMSLAFFDPRAGRYETMRQEGLSIRVLPGAGRAMDLAATNTGQKGAAIAEVPPDPIQPLKLRESGMGRRKPWVLSWWSPVVMAAPWLFFGGWKMVEWLRLRRIRSGKDLETAVQGRIAGMRTAAWTAAQARDAAAFHESLHDWIKFVLGRHLGLPAPGITSEVIDRLLIPKGFDSASAADLKELFGRLESARYGAFSADIPLDVVFSDADRVLAKVEELMSGETPRRS